MKGKIILVLALLSVVFCVAACGEQADSSTVNEKNSHALCNECG